MVDTRRVTTLLMALRVAATTLTMAPRAGAEDGRGDGESGWYHSGTGPFSEPESRAISDFVAKVEPHELVSKHAPLFAVDSYQL